MVNEGLRFSVNEGHPDTAGVSELIYRICSLGYQDPH